MDNIGDRLAKLRKENHYSQIELSEKIGVSRQAISKWEIGETYPNSYNIVCLAKLYNITTDEILTGEKTEPSQNINVKVKKHKTLKVHNEDETFEKYSIKQFFINRTLKFYLILVSLLLILVSAILYFVAFSNDSLLINYVNRFIPSLLLSTLFIAPFGFLNERVSEFIAPFIWIMTLIATGLIAYTTYDYFCTICNVGSIKYDTLEIINRTLITDMIFLGLTLITSFISITLTRTRRKAKKE